MTSTARNDQQVKRPHVLAFTLIELMISIALSLILILGINAVFKYTTQAVGQGQAINAATRDSRAAQTVFSSDFSAIVPSGSGANDSASIIIRSAAQPAYRDRADELGDKDAGTTGSTDPKLTIDINGDGKEGDPQIPGETISPATYNYRNHRIDVLSFFARNLFARQTGNPGVYVAPMASQEAWIWYGHLWLPDNTGAYPFGGTPSAPLGFPGSGDSSSANPNNHYAAQFVLGRVATLLRLPDPATNNIYLDPVNKISPQYYVGDTSLTTDLSPLAFKSKSGSLTESNHPNGPYFLENSRFDLAGTSISTFRSRLRAYTGAIPWYDAMMNGNPTAAGAISPNSTRFQCNPFVSKPLDAHQMAQASPYFLAGCTQFIVEFAGDYLKQDLDPSHTPAAGFPTNYGQVLNTYWDNKNNIPGSTDGQMDFIVDPVTGQKRIRWYGLPRSESGNVSQVTINDVVPLRDVWQTMNDPANTGAGQTQTREATFFAPIEFPTFNVTGNLMLPSGGNYAASSGGMKSTDFYSCAFGPDNQLYPAPMLIRITITLTDSSGRLPDGLTYQYVFPVPAQ